MSNRASQILGYEEMVTQMLRAFPEDDAMARAVGGEYERFGILEHAVLLDAGLFPEAHVLDVGCGSGRLAVQLARYPGLTYAGTDVVARLLAYAAKRAAREDFRFVTTDGHRLPVDEGSQDFITFFSVITHLLHEESYAYLAESFRALKPGGKVVMSFLEFGVEDAWKIFLTNVDWVRQGTRIGHLNVFLSQDDIALWARHLGFEVETLRRGDERWIQVPEAAATAELPAGAYAFGQSVCVLRKPGGGGAASSPRPGPVTGVVDWSPSPGELGGWARAEEASAPGPIRVEVRQHGRLIGAADATQPRSTPEGASEFHIRLTESLDDSAAILGGLQVCASLPDCAPVSLPLHDSLLSHLRQRHARRALAALTPQERQEFLRQLSGGQGG